jgi:hypothetical protein
MSAITVGDFGLFKLFWQLEWLSDTVLGSGICTENRPISGFQNCLSTVTEALVTVLGDIF